MTACIAFAAAMTLLPETILATEIYPGVPTRSQNPLLQGYFIPAMPITTEQQWSFSHSLYITNTYQVERNAREDLVVDIENTRYDFQATYRQSLWHFNVNLSLISNNAGVLDQTIERWHDFFGLPQGGRSSAAHNRLELFYEKDGVTVVDNRQSDSGIGDIQLAAGYQLSPSSQLWFGIELPSGDDNPLFSNEGIDLALWYAVQSSRTDKMQTYGLGGIALPADSGLFENRMESQILFGQVGLVYHWRTAWEFFVQAEAHSRIVKDSDLDALDHSLQGQFGLRLPALMKNYQLDLFFSEDISPGHAPDITFALRVSPR